MTHSQYKKKLIEIIPEGVQTSDSLYSTILVSQSVQLLSRVQLFATMNLSTPGLPVHHQLPEFTQIHIHWVSDAI